MSSRLTFDPWESSYATRLSTMRSSAVRDLFAAATRSDIISLSGGMPDISGLPLEQVARAAYDAIRTEALAALQYGSTPGRLQCRMMVCRLLEDLGIRITPDDVQMTSGSQEALDMLGKMFINPGDVVICEGPTYLGALQAFSAYEPRIECVGFDEQGMRMDLLEAKLAELGPGGAKFIYTIPNFQNPGGVTMTLERRHRLSELAHAYNVPVIEDDPYGRLRYEGDDVPAIRTFDPDVIYLGTVSKTFAPGLRVAWVVAPPQVLARCNLIKQGANLCSSVYDEVLCERYFADVDWRGALAGAIGRYHERRDAMLSALEEFFPPEASWTHPEGGFFLWVTLPPYFDCDRMLPQALDAGVTYVPGTSSFPDGRGRNCMRLAFCYETPENIREAVRRLAKVIEGRMGLARALIRAGYLPGGDDGDTARRPRAAEASEAISADRPSEADAVIAPARPDAAAQPSPTTAKE